MMSDSKTLDRVAYDFFIGNCADLNWKLPIIVEPTNTAVMKIVEVTNPSSIYIQNVGTVPVKLDINGVTSGEPPAEFHFILPGGEAQDDGRGAQFIVRGFRGVISGWTDSGTGRLAIAIGEHK